MAVAEESGCGVLTFLASSWEEIGSRMEMAAREHRYTGVVPALRSSKAAMLLCCSAGALADLKAEVNG
ncbi:hypothetical protein AB0D94_22685 [Streptomyces sp. NPDC048255]|uniref:hypothetical protein n=1 Tax=Streptomyces sp. NPDC048255 TaxID=3154713 RepID=UPI0033D47ECD